jgi:hypothetical protein
VTREVFQLVLVAVPMVRRWSKSLNGASVGALFSTEPEAGLTALGGVSGGIGEAQSVDSVAEFGWQRQKREYFAPGEWFGGAARTLGSYVSGDG